jgi:hypothetical protein
MKSRLESRPLCFDIYPLSLAFAPRHGGQLFEKAPVSRGRAMVRCVSVSAMIIGEASSRSGLVRAGNMLRLETA